MNKNTALVSGIIITIVLLGGCAEKMPGPPPLSVSEDSGKEKKVSGLDEEQKILSFDMTGYTKDGKKKWDIKGKSADIVSDTIILNSIEANVYSEERLVSLKAKSGRYDKKNSSIRLEDDVVVTTSDKVRLIAEWFEWESKTDEIKTDSFVEVTRDNFYASGHGALASTKHKKVQLNKNVTVKQDKITITCGGPLYIDYGANKASFYDMVKVIEPRGELMADRLDIFFNPDSQKMEKAIAEKNVELKRGRNIARGRMIVYTLADGRALLTGNPEILIYSEKELEDALVRN
ncbi:MAG: LPS export ABC transporter periplasmic protein LptC [Candidatus Omnitrophota bacterium]|nr:LPS export ABC transporter periplasmic protein LptC [Candidatus Omnitrophota bacterium]